ncbi:DUF2071 domain-containing protein [Pseudenhygromyxa sp. WMMC2535]|uniref:YqjF family protein n=1 Tax=Pseudenhygromyxa sp. WMMC2535 TaxID=2712867 RepID=UPI00155652D8|nr:DUF2071 domain-containing protein [Pseudenhygromyxa sp. WMMC2535]NVB43238.1 DUF2071 domain-containing protein [Pseudenhygromyxa sp. WMMC2535]
MPNWSALLEHREHRPWPLPERPWIMTMSWRELLFAHWRVDPERLSASLPAGLSLDTYQGEAWLGVVPFRMANVGPRGLNWLPGASAFPELNVRTYVVKDGKPGVWFFSLDAANALAVHSARTGFFLPYFRAQMRCERREDGWIDYRSERRHPPAPAGVFEGRYRGVGEVYRSSPGTLEHWLTERYCLYASDRKGQVRRGEIHHMQWPLQRAEAEISACSVSDGWGLALPDEAPLLHYVHDIDVVCWLPERA